MPPTALDTLVTPALYKKVYMLKITIKLVDMKKKRSGSAENAPIIPRRTLSPLTEALTYSHLLKGVVHTFTHVSLSVCLWLRWNDREA